MSMLAEPKRKQKWSLNPRGKIWSEDGNKFGQKLLEKMGWSHGKGLGAKEDGMTEHIKVSYKNDSQGIGYKESDNQWTEHESNFSALLASLSGGEKNDELKLSSLEEKSQNSRARVHYKKFTRGKDLSKYSEKDLANIFGKKCLKTTERTVKNAHRNKEFENSQSNEDKNFSNAGLMSDYFKKKLPSSLKMNDYVIGNNGVLQKSRRDSESESEIVSSFGFGFKQDSPENNHGEPLFVSYINGNDINENGTPKKKRKKKRTLDETSNVEEGTPIKKTKLEVAEQIPIPSLSKKKKKKKDKVEESGLSNPAFDPMHTPCKVDKHILEPIEESLNESLNDSVDQTAETFEVQVQIVNESTPLKCASNGELKSKSPQNMKKKKIIDLTKNDDTPNKKKKPKNAIESPCLKSIDLVQDIEESMECLEKSITPTNSKKKKIKVIDVEDPTYSFHPTEESQVGIENPIFNESLKSIEINEKVENPYEVKIKKKKKKKNHINKENVGLENPVFNIEDTTETNHVTNEEFEIKRQDRKKKKKKQKDENGLDNPALNLNSSIEESCDLMLNVVATPVSIPSKIENSFTEEVTSITKIRGVSRRKSVRFSDVTRERFIPTKEEIENHTLDETRDIVEIEGKLNDSSDLTYIDLFVKKKKLKKKSKGQDNVAFDLQATQIEENINSMAKTIDNFQAEIENDINETKIKSVEMEDFMVGEVGNPDGDNEKLSDGTVKLKFKHATFKKKNKYMEFLTGPKKSYTHLIKGDIILGFKETNLHEINGYAVV